MCLSKCGCIFPILRVEGCCPGSLYKCYWFKLVTCRCSCGGSHAAVPHPFPAWCWFAESTSGTGNYLSGQCERVWLLKIFTQSVSRKNESNVLLWVAFRTPRRSMSTKIDTQDSINLQLIKKTGQNSHPILWENSTPTIPMGGSCKKKKNNKKRLTMRRGPGTRVSWPPQRGLRIWWAPRTQSRGVEGKWPVAPDDNGNSAAGDKKRSFEWLGLRRDRSLRGLRRPRGGSSGICASGLWVYECESVHSCVN